MAWFLREMPMTRSVFQKITVGTVLNKKYKQLEAFGAQKFTATGIIHLVYEICHYSAKLNAPMRPRSKSKVNL